MQKLSPYQNKLAYLCGLFYYLSNDEGNQMPMKDPDVWALIWAWLQVNIGNGSIQSAGAAIAMSLLRIGFMRKKPSFRYMLIDAAICASIAGVAVPVCTHVFGHADFSAFFGTMIGFIGTEKIREYLFKFINRRIEKDDAHFTDDVQ